MDEAAHLILLGIYTLVDYCPSKLSISNITSI